MPTFGGEPFGSGRFGRGSWAKRVLWGNVPGEWQGEDALRGDVLQRLLGTWADELELIRDQIRELPHQRDPYYARGSVGTEEWLYFTSAVQATDTDYGTVTVLSEPALVGSFPFTLTASPPGWVPYAPITKIAPTWQAEWHGAKYRVVNVRTRMYDAGTPAWSDPNEVWLTGVPLGSWPAARYGYVVGTCGTSASATAVLTLPDAPFRCARNATPAPTPWLQADAGLEVRYTSTSTGLVTSLYDVPHVPYDGYGHLCPAGVAPGTINPGYELGVVDYERGEATIDLTTASDTIVALSPIVADWTADGYYVACRPASLLDSLAKDFGFANDANDPESVQRATIAHSHKYFGLKATADSYRIRGEVSGFEVVATPLHLLADPGFVALLPASSVFYAGGKWYTTVAPRCLRFDEIGADVSYWDRYDSTYKTLIDNCFLFEDVSAGGLSIGQAFALDVSQGYAYPGGSIEYGSARTPATVVSVTDLTKAEAALYNLPGGHRIVVSILKEAYADFHVFRKGAFGLTVYDRSAGVPPALDDFVWWIDESLGVIDDPGFPTTRSYWTVVIGQITTAATPAVGVDVAVRYCPDLLADSCGFCRSNRMRVEITPILGAWGAESYYGAGVGMGSAVDRLIAKVETLLIPLHVRVLEYALITPVVMGGPALTVVAGDAVVTP